MKKILLLLLFIAVFAYVTSFNVLAAEETYTSDGDYEIVTSDKLTKYVLDFSAVRQEQVLSYEVAWRSYIAQADETGQHIEFIFNEERTEGYSLGAAVTNTIGGAVTLPGVAEISEEVSFEASYTFSQTDSFSSGVNFTQDIMSSSDFGFWQLQLKIPTTKEIVLDGQWKKYTRTKFLLVFYTSWKLDESFNGGLNAEDYFTFDLATSEPVLDLVKIANPIGSC